MTRTRQKPLLRLRVDGPGVKSGGIRVPDLVKICEHTQSAVNRKAESMEGQRSLRRGPITSSVKSECTLELTRLRKGSVMLSFGLAKPQLPLPEATTFGAEVVAGVACDISSLGEKPKGFWEESFDPGLLDSLKNLGDVFEGKSITRIEWLVPRRIGHKKMKAVYTKTVRERVMERIKRPGRETTSIEGVLEMADFKESDKKCRIHPAIGYPVPCTFDPEKEEDVYATLRKPVRVTGEATLDPNTQRIESLHIRELSSLDPLALGASAFSSGKSFEELAAIQGVKPLESIGVLAGGWPEEENLDEVLEEIYHDREL